MGKVRGKKGRKKRKNEKGCCFSFSEIRKNESSFFFLSLFFCQRESGVQFLTC